MSNAPAADPTTPASQRLLWIYLVNATLVLCHEIDSAFWREWDLFRLPGGATVFVALHLIVVPLLLLGLVQVAREHAAGRTLSLLVGALGFLGGVAHSLFLLQGDGRFRTPFSVALILAFGLSSAALVVAALRTRAPRPTPTQS